MSKFDIKFYIFLIILVCYYWERFEDGLYIYVVDVLVLVIVR